jgi:uncharacterized protein (TIGR00159 family)
MLEIGAFQISWREILDIALVAFIFYRLILLVRGTRAVPVIYGLVLLIAVYYVAGEFGLFTLHWLLANFLGSIFLVIIILFQRDIRNALSQVGAGSLWRRGKPGVEKIDELTAAIMDMAEKHMGAIVVIEKNVPLGDLTERGVSMDARLSRKLLMSIFYPGTPLHDGAVIMRGGRIVAAGCILPLAAEIKGRHDYGTRHRAAVGVTEESDAVAVVVSEERGAVSVAVNGKLTASLDEVRLKRVLTRAWEK